MRISGLRARLNRGVAEFDARFDFGLIAAMRSHRRTNEYVPLSIPRLSRYSLGPIASFSYVRERLLLQVPLRLPSRVAH